MSLSRVREDLRRICGPEHVLVHPHALRTYESDGLLHHRVSPAVAVLPGSAEEVRRVVRACHDAGVPWVARGSGTGLSGGALPVSDGVLIVLTRLRRILEVDLDNQRVIAEPGVTNVETTDHAGAAVSDIVAAGIVPGAIEMMDRPTIRACEAATHAGYPLDAGAALIVELDGPEAECRTWRDDVVAICEARSATGIRIAADEAERQLIWKARKAAFAAMGRISPNYYVQDGVIPRTRLSEVLRHIDALSERFGLPVANVFHAGDGNLHPLVCYDARNPGEAQRAEDLATLIIDACLEVGGSITGEHGVGVDKKA